MSLATKCPHCHTTFKVANDQLKLQSGLVRCGICQHIFNGIDYIVDVNAEVKSVHIEIPSKVPDGGDIQSKPQPEAKSLIEPTSEPAPVTEPEPKPEPKLELTPEPELSIEPPKSPQPNVPESPQQNWELDAPIETVEVVALPPGIDEPEFDDSPNGQLPKADPTKETPQPPEAEKISSPVQGLSSSPPQKSEPTATVTSPSPTQLPMDAPNLASQPLIHQNLPTPIPAAPVITQPNVGEPASPFSDAGNIEEIVIGKSKIDDIDFDKEVISETTSKSSQSARVAKSVRTTTYNINKTEVVEQFIQEQDQSIEIKTQSVEPKSTRKEKPHEVLEHDEQTDHKQLTFVRQADTKKRLARLFSVGTLVLSMTLVGQTFYQLRNYISAYFPSTQRAMVAVCGFAGCKIDQLKQLDALSYEAAELHTLARSNTFEFGLLMHNHSALTQAWPHIELTLQNAQKQPMLKRVFAPKDYLTNPADVERGFVAHQEHAVQLYFELEQLKATDFTAEIFYP